MIKCICVLSDAGLAISQILKITKYGILIMKKSVLAVAIAAAAFAASAASAAQVYDKDGTTLSVGGMVEVIASNAGNNYFGTKSQDATTRERAILNMSGRTQITSGIAAYATNDWRSTHKGDSAEATKFEARNQFVGVDFGKFGKVQAGRYADPFTYAVAPVDVLDEVGVYGSLNERNSGHLSYMWSGYGFDAGVSYQFATDNYNADDFFKDINVDSGFSLYAGYTSPVVLFGPISARVGYLYLNAQNVDDNQYKSAYDDEDGTAIGIDNIKTVVGSLAWGTNGKGFYAATAYSYSKAKVTHVWENDDLYDLDSAASLKVKAWETVMTYGFDNGIRIGASYHWIKGIEQANEKDKSTRKYVELIADYNVTPNFKVWTEACIDAGSDDYFARVASTKDDKKDSHNLFMVGAKYTF